MFWLMVVAILGTTISPYLFFWQAAQEVEDTKASQARAAAASARQGGGACAHPARYPGRHGYLQSRGARDHGYRGRDAARRGGITESTAPRRRRRRCGRWPATAAFALFALGIVGTGLLRCRCWPVPRPMRLGSRGGGRWALRKPAAARGFYATIASHALGRRSESLRRQSGQRR